MNTFKFCPTDATEIGKTGYAFRTEDGLTTYFTSIHPIDCHLENDKASRLIRIAKFARQGIRHKELEKAFGVSRTTVHRAQSKLIRMGEAAFYAPMPVRGGTVFVGKIKQEADRMLASGMSGAAVARELGLSRATVSYNRRKGVIGQGVPSNMKTPSKAKTREAENSDAPASDEAVADVEDSALCRSARDRRDRAAPMGRAARDHAGRIAASVGAMGEVQPSFEEPLSAVTCGGVLTALPALLKEGLLDRAGAFLSLPRGYYGLTSILLLLAFLFMARVRNPEALRHEAPGEWGAILGLDRCPEAKTLRRKIRLLASDEQQVRNWQSALAQDWIAEIEETVATLSVDGHVKVYTGRKGRLPKHFVSRQKLCLPASTSYWVNMLGGAPLLCLHESLDPGMVRALERGVLPALERLGLLGLDAPDLQAEPQARPAVRLVFDREGWSPALFARLARRGVSVITWHKGFKGEGWPEDEFRTVQVPVHGPGGTGSHGLRLCEKPVQLKDGLKVRQIRRLLDSGRQVAIVTTDFCIPMEQIAGALFSRWAQENYFKYMREEFALDHLPVHGVADLDPDARVVNPARRELDRQLRNLRQRLGQLRNRVADLLRGTPSEAAIHSAARLQGDIEQLDTEHEALKLQRQDLSSHLMVSELSEEQMLDALPCGEKLLLDILRMIAYRAETRMMPAVAEAQGSKRRPRRALAELFQSEADIIPDAKNGVLRVRILGTASNAGDAAIAGLLDELNSTRTHFPGTDMRMVYELPTSDIQTDQNVSK